MRDLMIGREWISFSQSFIDALDQLVLLLDLNPFGYIKSANAERQGLVAPPQIER
jgi:hypothetical protein